jgi:ABC-type glycerol-3-phosphate transport system substrate-binding protein
MNKKLLVVLSVLLALSIVLGACTPAAAPAAPAPAEPAAPAAPVEPAAPAAGSASVIHYFSDTLGKETITGIFDEFTKKTGDKVVDNTTGHEDFKTQILVMLAGDNPPDIFSYWAGARVQFVVDSDRLEPMDAFWAENKLDDILPAAMVANASTYNGKKYLVPLGYHYAGLFYNPKTMEAAGITEFPTTWDGFLSMCETLKAAGITPVALGSKDRWPAQFWFDYLLLRTAGPDYRNSLMAGTAKYTDPEVVAAMELWKDLVEKGYFVADANAYGWTDAADQVANGQAGMTLMGTWITGYYNGNDLKPGEDYDFFPFPSITAGVPEAVVGPVDGFVLSAGAKDKATAQKLLFHLLDPKSQAVWAQGQGALAPSTKVDPSIYNSVMKKASDQVAKSAVFAFNYDLATTPPMAEGGLNMFAQFMNDPSKFQDYLAQTEAVAVDVFKK